MIKERTMYTVICDNCKYDIGSNSEYSCWNDNSYARENAMESEWLEQDDKHYCPDCFTHDENDNIIINKARFKE